MSAVAFVAIGILTLAAALAAASLSRLIHAALCLAAAFVGVAAFFFLLGAEFVGLVQVFVYVGAVAVLIVFTILLTRRETEAAVRFRWSGAVVAAAVFAGLLAAVLKSTLPVNSAPSLAPLTVKHIGDSLMTSYVWPLQCVGLVLTVALIGAMIVVMEDRPQPPQ
jgi:NADH-quinone oxidoreductase subunit J